MEGFIAIHRKIFEWEWYSDPIVFKFFIHCLLKANHKDKEWRGKLIKRGSFITSLSGLSDQTGLTIKQVRRAIECLISTNELGKVTTSLNTLITVTYYDKYQSEGKQKANEGQTKGKRRATTNNDNNDNKELYSFDEFWDDYDYKKGLEAAKKAWKKLNDSEKIKIKETVKAFKAHKPFKDYNHPLPASYLNGKRFNDEIGSSNVPPQKTEKETIELDIRQHLTHDEMLGEVPIKTKYKDYNGLFYNQITYSFHKEPQI